MVYLWYICIPISAHVIAKLLIYLNSLTLWKLRGVKSTHTFHWKRKDNINVTQCIMHGRHQRNNDTKHIAVTLSVNMLILKSILTLHAMLCNKTRQNVVHVWSRQPIQSYEKSKKLRISICSRLKSMKMTFWYLLGTVSLAGGRYWAY